MMQALLEEMKQQREQQQEEMIEQREQHAREMKEMLDQMKRLQAVNDNAGDGQPGQPNQPNQLNQPRRTPAEILQEKQQSVFANLGKSGFKKYSISQQKPIKTWLRDFDNQLDILAKSADLEIAQITAVNHVNLIRSKLECEAIQDMTIRLQTLVPPLTWATVTVPRPRELLIEQYDKKQPK